MTSDTKTYFLIPDLLKIVIEYVDGDIGVDLDLDKLDWKLLSDNPSAVYILEKESNQLKPRINWVMLANNHSPITVNIIKKNICDLYQTYDNEDDGYGWELLASNPFAMDIIEKNLDDIDMHQLCLNTSDRALDIIEKNLERFDRLDWLCENTTTRAIHIIEKI